MNTLNAILQTINRLWDLVAMIAKCVKAAALERWHAKKEAAFKKEKEAQTEEERKDANKSLRDVYRDL